MTEKYLYSKIVKMNLKLNDIIIKENFDLQSPEVIRFSQKLDRILDIYIKKIY